MGRLALKKGRDGLLWFFISILISPVLCWIILNQIGDTEELKAQKLVLKAKADNDVDILKNLANEPNEGSLINNQLVKIEEKKDTPLPKSIIRNENNISNKKNDIETTKTKNKQTTNH